MHLVFKGQLDHKVPQVPLDQRVLTEQQVLQDQQACVDPQVHKAQLEMAELVNYLLWMRS